MQFHAASSLGLVALFLSMTILNTAVAAQLKATTCRPYCRGNDVQNINNSRIRLNSYTSSCPTSEPDV